MQVLTAGTRMEQDQEKGKPMQVTVVTLLVNPEQSERLALASTEGKIQLALRNPLDQTSPETPGVKTAGARRRRPRRPSVEEQVASSRPRSARQARGAGDDDADGRADADRGSDPRRQAGAGSYQVSVLRRAFA